MGQFNRRTFLSNGGGALLAAGLGGSVLAACSGDSGNKDSATIRYQYRILSDLPDIRVVESALNDYIKGKGKSFTLKLEPMPDFTEKMALAMTTGNVGDMFYTSPNHNDFYKNSNEGNFLALDDLLPKHAPTLYESMPKEYWNAAKVKGKTYAVINQQRFPKLWGFTTRKDLADKYDLDLDSITTQADLEPFLAKIKKGEPNMVPQYTDNLSTAGLFSPEQYGWDPIAVLYGMAVRRDDDDLKIFNFFDTDEYRSGSELIRRWRSLGYTTSEPLASADAQAKILNGQFGVFGGQALPTNPQLYPFPTVQKTYVTQPILNTDGLTATMTALSRDTENAEEAMQYIELLNSDKDFYNLMCFGIENKHYVFTDKSLGVVGFPAGQDKKSSPYYPNADWMFGNQFNAYYRTLEDAKADRWKVEAEINKNAVISNALGFVFDTNEYKTQVATVTAAIKQFAPPIATGVVDPGQGITKLVERMKQAGIEDMIEGAQKQIDEWKKNK